LKWFWWRTNVFGEMVGILGAFPTGYTVWFGSDAVIPSAVRAWIHRISGLNLDGIVPAFGNLNRRCQEVAILFVIERMSLAGRAAGCHAMATCAYQPVDLRCDQFEINLAVLAERRCHRRYHAGWTYLHGGSSLLHWLGGYCPAFSGALTGQVSLIMRAAASQRQE